MILTLKHLYNNNIKFLFFYLKIKIDSVDSHLQFLDYIFESCLDKFFFLDFCFLFTKTKGNYFYVKIIFFFFNILDVSSLYIKHISQNIDFDIGWGKEIYKVKKLSLLNVKGLSCLLKTGVFKYSLTIFDLTKNFQAEYHTLSTLFKVKTKKIILKNVTEDYLLPLINSCYSTFYNSKILKKRRKKPTDLLFYLIKVYFFRNGRFHLKNILKHYKKEEVDKLGGFLLKDWTLEGPRIYFYEYLKTNFDHVLGEIYSFYYRKFGTDGQVFKYFLYAFINADRKKILMYFKFDVPCEYSTSLQKLER